MGRRCPPAARNPSGGWVHRRQAVASRQFLPALPLTLASHGAAIGIGSAMAVAADLGNVEVVLQPVHCRNAHGTAGEDLIPGREWLIGGDQQRTALVTVAGQHD